MLGGFTHGGRPLRNVDDYQDDIPVSSEDEGDDQDTKQGKLNEEMVMAMNFGGGKRYPFEDYPGQDETSGQPKSRKEVFEEIIAKSKAYKMAKYEIKEAGKELTDRLDSEYFDLLPLLNLSKVKEPAAATSVASKNPLIDSYELIASKLKES